MEVGVFERQRWQVVRDFFTLPPGAVGAGFGEVVEVEIGADEFGPGVGERVVGEEAEGVRVVGEKLTHQIEDPRVVAVVGHGCEPHLPVEFPVPGGDEGRAATRVAGFALEFVGAPGGVVARDSGVGAFEDDFVAVAGDAAEGAVGVDEMQRLEAGVHGLFTGEEIDGGTNTQEQHEREQRADGDAVRERRSVWFVVMDGDEAREKLVVETRNAERDSDVIEPGQIAADDEGQLKVEHQQTRENTDSAPRREEEPWGDKFDDVREEHAGLQPPMREMVEVPTDRIGQRLGFVMVVETGQVAPAGVAAEFDHARAEHDAEEDPEEQPKDYSRRFGVTRAEKDAEETAFEEDGFPAEAVEDLADIDEGKIEQPE